MSPKPLTVAIMVAAGSSTRMGGGDKLFIPVAGKPLVAHTWLRLAAHAAVDQVVVVCRADRVDAFQELGRQCAIPKPFAVVPGGARRQDSVWNGLVHLPEAVELVLVQDGARPCTPDDLISRTLEAARETGAAVAAHRVTDTIKESADGRLISRTVDRARLWAVQTPQTFRYEVLKRALERATELGVTVTDDTAACELIGQPVALVESSGPNPKITFPHDVQLMEQLIKPLF